MGKYNGLILVVLLFFVNSLAFAHDSYISGYMAMLNPSSSKKHTVLDKEQYQKTIATTRTKVKKLLADFAPYRSKDLNEQIRFIVQNLSDIPYMYAGATGEGDWQPSAKTYQPGAIHLKQDPVYRLDGLDCLTFVQMVLALLNAKNLDQFDETILKIAYGAAGNPHDEIVRFYNRNHFVDGDWNPINQHNGFISDVTANGILSAHAKETHANITRQHWFLHQQANLSNIRVLDDSNGPAMVQRLKSIYSKLDFPHFISQNISISYLPKEMLVLQNEEGNYYPNEALFAHIPTPAIVEIVRDAKKWYVSGKPIKTLIGSELTISHLGILYRQTFKENDLIYKKIICGRNEKNHLVCNVKPIICHEKECTQLMFAHATNAYPDNLYLYQHTNNSYACSSHPPPDIALTRCNRVEQVPLFNYLADLRTYSYMKNPSILGIHIEKILA